MAKKIYASEEFVRTSVLDLSTAKPLSWLLENYPELVTTSSNIIKTTISLHFNLEEDETFPLGLYVNDLASATELPIACSIYVNGEHVATLNESFPYIGIEANYISLSEVLTYTILLKHREITIMYDKGDGSYTVTNNLLVKRAEVLTKYNTEEFTPTEDYHPATKKYVDDSAKAFQDDYEQIEMLIQLDMLPAVHNFNGAILTDENGNVVLRY